MTSADRSPVDHALSTLEQARDLALVVIDADLRIALAVGGLIAARGHRSQDCVGRLVADLMPSSDADVIVPRYRTALGGEAQAFEHRFASGHRCRIDARPNGAAPHRTATILWRDIAQQPGASAARELSDERCRLLAESASDVVSLQTLDGHYLWISPSLHTVLGYEPEELLGAHPDAFVHPDDVVAIRERHARLCSAGGTTRSLFRARHANGSYRWIETAMRAVSEPGLTELGVVVATGRDVTERVLGQQALRGVEARARTLLDTMADAAILYDADGAVISRSQRSVALLGPDDEALRLGTAESVGGWSDVDGAPLAPGGHPAILARRSPEPLTSVVALRQRDGARRWLRATASAIRDAERSGEVVLTLFDITDLRETRVELERSNEDLRQMALVASHDLGAPLAMLRRELDGLPANQLPRSVADSLGRAGQAAGIMQEILGAMLGYAQVDRAAVEREAVDLAAVVAETRAILRGQLESTRAVLRVGALPTVMGDRVLLRQLLQNLVGNAITHHPRSAPQITVRSERRGSTIVLIVEDDGDGIPKDRRSAAFGLFVRGDSPTSGHGIGLATVKRIVELHDGRIWIEAVAPHGARICMTLGEIGMPG